MEGTKFTKIWPDAATEIDQEQVAIEAFNERVTD
jgi:hypothetical protein